MDPASRKLNGIDVSTGADIYEQRLHINGRITGVRYQRYADWNNGRSIYYPLVELAGLDALLMERRFLCG